jgi:hypothetical protein
MQKEYKLCYQFNSDLFMISGGNRRVHHRENDNFCLKNGLQSGTVASVAFVVGTEMYNEAFHLTAIHQTEQEAASHQEQTSATQCNSSCTHDSNPTGM